jgi:hypothetical protein
MNFAAPGWIGLAALASLAVVAIHLIAWRLPRTVVLPTARFVPDEPARRAARTVRLADLALLALRVAIVMTGGIAMARPVFEARPSGSATVVALAGGFGDTLARRDSVRVVQGGELSTFVVFDTSAQVVTTEAAALAAAQSATEASLTTGLLAAIREAHRLGQEYDTVRIVVVSPFVRTSFDNATHAVRSMWPDAIQLVRIPSGEAAARPTTLDVESTGDDPVVAGIRLARANGLIRGESRVIREGPATAPAPGTTVVVWPKVEPNDNLRVDAVHANDVTAIGQFIPSPSGDSGRVIARWVNGAPAAREVVQGGGCVRNIGFDVPDVGDFVLTPSFQRLAAELLAPCGGVRHVDVAPDSMLAALSAPVSDARSAIQGADDSRNRIAAILMVLAVLLGILELITRRRSVPALAEQRA